MGSSRREQERHMRRIKREALSLADRAERSTRRREDREARRGLDRKTRARVRIALTTLRRLARLARGRLVRRQVAERRAVLAELRARFRLERQELRSRFRERRAAIQTIGLSAVERRRQLRATAREEARKLRESRKAEEQARRELVKAQAARRAAERIVESDDEVIREIETHHPEWLGLWRKVKGSIKARPGMSRAEAFFHYAAENPGDVWSALDEGQDDWIRQQEEALYREHGIERRPKRERRAAHVVKAPKAGKPWHERISFEGKHWPGGMNRYTREELRRADAAIERGEWPRDWATVAVWLRGDSSRRIVVRYLPKLGEVVTFRQRHRGRTIEVDRKALITSPADLGRVAYRFVHLEIEDSSDPDTQFVRVWEREQAKDAPPF